MDFPYYPDVDIVTKHFKQELFSITRCPNPKKKLKEDTQRDIFTNLEDKI